MTNEALFDPRLPVRVLLERSAAARSVLASYGIDSCCGGEHPLELACRAKGVPLGEVLVDLQSAHRVAEAQNRIPPTMTVREVLRRFPSTAPVLERYGLSNCGGAEGPEEPLAWFATVHRLPLEDFLRDVREAALRDAVPAQGPAASTAAPTPFSPHFILGSLFLTLTLGATTGMINLLRIAAGGDVPISHRQIHGHTQILGFAALFLMGIAYHALPRILGIGGLHPRSARPSFWMMFTGVLLRNLGQPLAFYATGRALSLISAGLEAASALLFARFVFGLLRRVREGKYDRKDPILRFVAIGTVCFLLAILFDSAQGIWLAGHFETALPAALVEPFYFAALYGFLLAWVYGFGNRVVSLFLGVGGAIRRTPETAMIFQIGAVPLFTASYLPGLPLRTALVLRDAGMTAAAVSALVYLAGNGFLWRPGVPTVMRAPGSPSFAIRAAFACLALWAILELAGVALVRTTRLPAQNLWWADSARHVFSVGFLTLLIVGMSFRILPVFSGKRLWSPRLAHATYGLLLGGVAMRLLQYPAAFEPLFYRIGSFMGIPVVLALLLFVFNLVRTMRGAGEPKPKGSPRPAVPFASTLPVRS
ncbi:MAG TPA: DUF542 domain-containing protein [Thermoanaerobaculia bacterium]